MRERERENDKELRTREASLGGCQCWPVATSNSKACGYCLPEAKNIQLFTVTEFKSSSYNCTWQSEVRFQQQRENVSITWDHLSVIETKDRENEKMLNKWRSKWAESFINYSCFCRYFKILFETYHLTFSTRTQTEKTTLEIDSGW